MAQGLKTDIERTKGPSIKTNLCKKIGCLLNFIEFYMKQKKTGISFVFWDSWCRQRELNFD